MISERAKQEAKTNFNRYLDEGLLKKETNETAKSMYLKNAELSLKLAEENMKSSLKPYLWVIVEAYYSMFYMANAILLHLGYKTGDKIVHKVTIDTLIVIVLGRIKESLLEEYKDSKADALEIASMRSEEIISHISLEKNKRLRFQYEVTESVLENKAITSLRRAKEFLFEMKKIY